MRIIGHAPAGVSPPFFLSSLPDLIRQSMRTKSSIGSADKLSEPHVSMDHRVKPGGDEVFWLWQNSGADCVARTGFRVVIAGLDPAIHADEKLDRIGRQALSAARQHGPPGQARW